MAKDRFQSGRNKDARQRGIGPRRFLPDLERPKRQYWLLVDPDSDAVPSLLFQSREEAENHARKLNKEFNKSYEVHEVDQSKSLRPEPARLDDRIPNSVEDLVYSLNWMQAANYNVTGRPNTSFCYLNFLVRDRDGKDTKISVEMDKNHLLKLAEYIFATLGNRI